MCTIIGNDANVDNYQLGTRLTGTVEAANILALHSEWDKAPRRLHLPSLTHDMSVIPDCADHITPRSWRASQSLHSVTPPTVWMQGWCRLEENHPFASEVLHSVESNPNSTMLAPFGTLLVYTALPTADTEELPQSNTLHGLNPEAITPEEASMPLTGDGLQYVCLKMQLWTLSGQQRATHSAGQSQLTMEAPQSASLMHWPYCSNTVKPLVLQTAFVVSNSKHALLHLSLTV